MRGAPEARAARTAMLNLKALLAKLPLPAYVRLLRHGKEVARSEDTSEFEFAVKEAGAYRLEAWLRLDGELRPWILSNPIYVR